MSVEKLTTLNNNIVTDIDRLNQAIEAKFDHQINLSGTIEFPCIPSLLDLYIERIEAIIKGLGKDRKNDHIDFIRFMIADHLEQGFAIAPDTCLKVTFQGTGKDGLRIKMEICSQTLDQRYQEWIEVREPPFFGEYPDAKVMDTLSQFSPHNSPILDIGAGTGRNTIPIARKGYNVDAVELTSVFAQELVKSVTSEKLPVQVIQSDILNPDCPVKISHYALAIASEVISTHIRKIEDLRKFLTVICKLLQDGGLFLFDVFMPINDYIPEQKVREMGQLNWCCIFTNQELNDLFQEFSLEIISNESAIEYEKKHQPSDAFPRNSWFTNWAKGHNIFALLEEENPPIELRWLLCRYSL